MKSLAILLAASVLAACSGLRSSNGGDHTDDALHPVLDASGFTKTRSALEATGWACFDTVEEPVPVRRCYLDGLLGAPHGTMTLRFIDVDHVGTIDVRIDGPFPDQVLSAQDSVGTAIADGLLGGQTDQMLAALRSSVSVSVAGADVFRNGPGYFSIADPAYEDRHLPDPDVLPPLAGVAEVRPLLLERGFLCEERGHGDADCVGTVGVVSIELTAISDGTEAMANEWFTTAGSVESLTSQQGLDVLVGLLREVGIVAAEAASILLGGLRPEGTNADAEGHHIHVGPDEPSAPLFVVTVIVDRYLN